MNDARTVRDDVRRCIETVESDDVWSAFATFPYSERANVTFGTADASGTDRGLSCQIEILDPAVYFDPDRLVVGATPLAATHPSLADLVENLSEAIAAATGEPLDASFVYRGLEPGTAASSAVFDATIREAA